MSTATASLAPSNPLVTPNDNPPPGVEAPKNRFILFGSQWLQLQNYITQALQLPINMGDWNEKYGDFSDKQQVQDCLNAMVNVHDLAKTFGEPATLKEKIAADPNYIFTPTPPDQIYGHIVWLSGQIQNTAGTFSNTFESLREALSEGTAEQRAEILKTILTGQGGLTSSAEDMQQKTADLMKKLLAFDKEFTAANTTVQEYSGSSSSILADANKLIGQLQENISETQAAADEAYKKWRDYTIAAITTSVGLMILTGGLAWPIALGLGIGLGVAAAAEKKAYNNLMDQVAKYHTDMKKKTRLVTDLTGLNSSIADIAPAMNEFKTSLETIEGVWLNIGMDLNYIATNYTVNQLGDLTWVMQTLKVLDAQKKWGDISTTAKDFSANSLVSYNFSTPFGQQIKVA